MGCPPRNHASSPGEAKDSALLSSRDAGLLEPPERPQVSSPGPALSERSLSPLPFGASRGLLISVGARDALAPPLVG